MTTIGVMTAARIDPLIAGASFRRLPLPPSVRPGTAGRKGGRRILNPGRASRPVASSAMGKLPLRARVATTLGGAAGRMSRLAGRGDGSVIGGVIGLRVEPGLLSLLAAGRQV